MKRIALLGRKSAGKTTFTCMAALVSNVGSKSVTVTSGGKSIDIQEIKEDFIDYNLFPPGTPYGITNIIKMWKESFLTMMRIFYVDCAGGVQMDALRRIYDCFSEEKEVFKEVLIKIGEEKGGELKEYIINNMLNNSISMNQALELKEIDKGDKSKDEIKSQILFIKSVMDSNELIVLIDGEGLRGYFDRTEAARGMYRVLDYYSSLIDTRNFHKVALVISKGHLFGVTKENYQQRLEEMKRYYVETHPGTLRLLHAIIDANCKSRLFCIGVPSAGFMCKDCEELHDLVSYQTNPLCPKCGAPLRERYTDRYDIFGIKEVLNWV